MEHILIEHISGYELFELKAFEDIAAVSYSSYLALTQVVNHVSSFSFNDAKDALEHIRYEGDLHPQLKSFLELNGVKVLHCDKSLKPFLQNVGIEFKQSINIMRGIKENLKKLLKKDLNKQMTLSVSHSFSKDEIKYNLEQEDNLVVVIEHEIGQLEREVDVLQKKLSHLIDWHIPLFKKFVKDSDFQSALKIIFEKKENPKSENSGSMADLLIEEMVEDLSQLEFNNIKMLNYSLLEKTNILNELKEYLEKKMRSVAPNLRQVLGDRLACKLINKSAGLTNLGLYPASTLQLLGAEKSLFQSLKMRKNTPKHGVIYDYEGLKENRGKMCRFIASKCSIAARIDAFSKDRTDEYGLELRKLIIRKIKAGNNTKAKFETTEELMEKVHSKRAREDSTGKEKQNKEIKTGEKNNTNNSNVSQNLNKNKAEFTGKNFDGKKINNKEKFKNLDSKNKTVKSDDKKAKYENDEDNSSVSGSYKPAKKRFDASTESSKRKVFEKPTGKDKSKNNSKNH